MAKKKSARKPRAVDPPLARAIARRTGLSLASVNKVLRAHAELSRMPHGSRIKRSRAKSRPRSRFPEAAPAAAGEQAPDFELGDEAEFTGLAGEPIPPEE